jgi:hypothetical protein
MFRPNRSMDMVSYFMEENVAEHNLSQDGNPEECSTKARNDLIDSKFYARGRATARARASMIETKHIGLFEFAAPGPHLSNAPAARKSRLICQNNAI